MNGIYKTADLVLFPLDFEADSLVVLESASCGLPTLALKNYGCGERIEDGVTGFLSDFDEESFTKKIWEILNNKPLLEKVKKMSTNFEQTLGKKWWQNIVNSSLKKLKNTKI